MEISYFLMLSYPCIYPLLWKLIKLDDSTTSKLIEQSDNDPQIKARNTQYCDMSYAGSNSSLEASLE